MIQGHNVQNMLLTLLQDKLELGRIHSSVHLLLPSKDGGCRLIFFYHLKQQKYRNTTKDNLPNTGIKENGRKINSIWSLSKLYCKVEKAHLPSVSRVLNYFQNNQNWQNTTSKRSQLNKVKILGVLRELLWSICLRTDEDRHMRKTL